MIKDKLMVKFTKMYIDAKVIDRGKSYWEVFASGKSLAILTVDEISGNKAEQLYDGIATQNFGRELIRVFKNCTSNKVTIMVKQTVPVEFIIKC